MADEGGAMIWQKNPETINDNRQQIPEMFRAKVSLNTTAWVLLFESKPIRTLLYESLTMSIVRQHSEIASETSIWGELTVSKHEKSWNLAWEEIYPAVMLCTHDNNKHADHTASFLDT